ncbi:MAG TPA: cyclodeaminase/cyclohydrolase family protein, partial [Bacillota bacterium]|nr:cyclodeaminase/cyclohydrolase family protein [Bacillota bacterium]
AITDVCVGVFLLDTAVRGASVNAKINLASIKDEEFKSQCSQKLKSAENDLSKYMEQLKQAIEQAGL